MWRQIKQHNRCIYVLKWQSQQQTHFSCPFIENFIWIEPLLRGHLSYKATFSVSQRWSLNTGLAVYIFSINDCASPPSNPGIQDKFALLNEISTKERFLGGCGLPKLNRKNIYSQTCIKRSPLGHRKSGLYWVQMKIKYLLNTKIVKPLL
jgi:hypothetical protein